MTMIGWLAAGWVAAFVWSCTTDVDNSKRPFMPGLFSKPRPRLDYMITRMSQPVPVAG